MLLEIKNFNIHFKSPEKHTHIHAVRDLSFSLKQGEILGVVGESGSGKSITNLALMGILGQDALVSAEKCQFQGIDLLKLTPKEWRKIRGKEIGMIFQDPMTALNPFLTIEYQLVEMIQAHENLSRKEAINKSIEMLTLVGIPSPKDRLLSYPFQLSGGMAQRVMIAMALSTNPKILIADEPTTALDVTIQKQILGLIKDLQVKRNMSVILVSHDLGLISEYTDNLQVMYAGEIIEKGQTQNIIQRPHHPYTNALLNARPGAALREKKSILPSIDGIVPSFKTRPLGCQFNPRCEYVKINCHQSTIPLEQTSEEHVVRCLFPINKEVAL